MMKYGKVRTGYMDAPWSGHRYFRMCAGWFERGHLNMKQPIVKLAFSTLMLAPVFLLPFDPSLLLILFCWFMVTKAFLTHLADTTSCLPIPVKVPALPSDRHAFQYASLRFFPVVAASPRPSSFQGVQESYRSPQQALSLRQGAKTRICAPAA
jgi:hypothetical protein